MKTIIIILSLVSFGCVGGKKSGIDYTKMTTLTNGVVIIEETVVRQPSDPKEGSYLFTSPDGLQAGTGSAQDASKKQHEIEKGKSKRSAFMWCGIVIVLGGVLLMLGTIPALGLTNGKSNKVGLIMMGAGGAGIAVVIWADAAAPFMGWLLPIAIVGGGGYIVWNYVQTKRTNLGD